MEIIFSLPDIDSAAKQILGKNPQKVILFNGEMGAGKTTLIKAIAKALGVGDTTGSPTFSLVNEYRTSAGETVYHFDMYRIKSEIEAYDMGIDEYLYSGHWCLIEWAEKISGMFAENHSSVDISVLSDGNRKLTFS